MLTYAHARDLFLAYCRSKNLSQKTVDYYKFRLIAVERDFKVHRPGLVPENTTQQDIRELISRGLDSSTAATVNHTICSLKAMFNYLHEEGYVEKNPMSRITKVKAPQRVIPAFTDEQITLLLATPNKKRFAGIRDYALMVLLLDTGLRIGEACNLTLDDIDWTKSTLRVMGKGSKERVVPFGRSARRELNAYLQRRGELTNDYVFVSEYGEKMTEKHAHQNLSRYGQAAGITGVRVSPHTFRHTFAVNWIRSGGDVFTLQMALGHSSLLMVKRYVSMANSDLETAHQRHSPADRLVPSGKEKAVKRTRLK